MKLTNDPDCIIDVSNYQTGDKDFTAVLTNLKAKIRMLFLLPATLPNLLC